MSSNHHRLIFILKNQMELKAYISLFSMLCLFASVLAGTASLTMTPSHKFADSGTFSFAIPTGLFTSLTTSVIFVRNQTDMSYRLLLMVEQFYYNTGGCSNINFSVSQDSRSLTQLIVRVSTAVDQIWRIGTLGLRYLIIVSSWGRFQAFYHLQLVNTNITSPYSFTVAAPTLVNMTGTVQMFYYIIAFDIVYNSDYGLALALTRNSTNSIAAVLSITSSLSVYCASIGFYSLTYNIDELNELSNPAMVYTSQHRCDSLGSATYIDSNHVTASFNTFFGLFNFRMHLQPLISWYGSINPGNSFSISSSNSNPTFYLTFNIFVITQFYCPIPYNYYYALFGICYDTCPTRYYGNDQLLECTPCWLYQCYTCPSDGAHICSLCLPADYRVYNATTQRCDPLPGYYDDGINSVAKSCSSSIINCTLCSGPGVCLQCSSGYLIAGGCSDVSECTQVQQIYFPLHTANCIICQYGQMIFQNNTCVCPPNLNIVTNHCTPVHHCIATIHRNNRTQCIACDIGHKFTLSNGSCICIDFYEQLSHGSNSTCIDICGDGKLFQLQCDDGNRDDGDGCSSGCRVQNKYSCFGGGVNSSSVCVYKGIDLAVSVDSIERAEDSNTGIFSFKINPPIGSISRMDLALHVGFYCGANFTINSIAYQKGVFTLMVDYTQDLQDKIGNLTLSFDPIAVIHTPITLQFPIKSKGIKLIVYGRSLNKQIKKVLFGLCLALLGVFVVGSIVHKMIGVQFVYTFILILLIYSFSGNYTLTYTVFQFLTYLTGNFQHFKNSGNNFNIQNSPFQFKVENYAQSQVFVLGIIGASVIVLIGLESFKKYFNLHNLQKQRNKLLIKIQTISTLFYNSLLFPAATIYLTQILLSNCLDNPTKIQVINWYGNRITHSLIKLFLISTSSIVFFNEWKHILSQHHKQSQPTVTGHATCKSYYIPTYLSFIICMAIISSLELTNIVNNGILVITIVTLLFLVWTVVSKPYIDTLHNVGLFVNLCTVVVFGVWTQSRNIFANLCSQQNQMYAIIVFIGLFGLNLIMTVCRIIHEVRRKCFTANSKNNNQSSAVQQKRPSKQALTDYQQKERERTYKLIQNLNPYSFDVMSMNANLKQWDQSNRERLLNDMNVLPFSNIKIEGDLLRNKKRDKMKKEESQNVKALKSKLRDQYLKMKMVQQRKINK